MGVEGQDAFGRALKVALLGQPNVGKSSLFSRLTGVGVISSNYPGTTVTFDEGAIVRNGRTVVVKDLPGTYSVSGNSDDERVVVMSLIEDRYDCVVLVADATSLVGSIVLCIEAMELGIPAILALNKVDAARRNTIVYRKKLESMLGIPVVEVSSKTSEGVDELADAICSGSARRTTVSPPYDRGIEAAIESLSDAMPDGLPFARRGIAVKLLEGSEEFEKIAGPGLSASADAISALYSKEEGHSIAVSTASARYALAGSIESECIKRVEVLPTWSERISDILIAPRTGIPILAAVCVAILAVVVYGGSFLDSIVSSAYDAIVGDAIISFGESIGGRFGEAVFTGIDGSFRAILTLVIPYILVFYLLLGVLEDSGYLTRAVVLLDNMMHRFGLHGGAFIPMIVGIGCNVPAIMAIRTINSRREKIILSAMIVTAVPCSAQMAIIFGATGKFSGLLAALCILVVLACLGALTGILLNRFLKYEPSNLAMELPPLQAPGIRNILSKTWSRIKDFIYIALPLLIVGSIVIEILITYNLLDPIVEPLSPITVGLLGLPAVCVISFIVGILRKEMALGMLQILAAGVPLAEFMTPGQFVVFGAVMAIYVPCIATMATMWREIGWKETICVSAMTAGFALVVGMFANLIVQMFR